ncbi:MAG: hypothetical protein V3V12_04115 [Gammaproteobacteria bacterium]
MIKLDAEGIPILDRKINLDASLSDSNEQLYQLLIESTPIRELIMEATGRLMQNFPETPTHQLKQDATLLVKNSIEKQFPEFRENIRAQSKQAIAVYEASGQPPEKH